MPPKKPTANSADPPAPSVPVEEKNSEAATLRKPAAHPSTTTMVKEALKELDSRKGLSSQAIQNYIKQKYPSVDILKLKHLVRRALKKGIETGTLVRPANSNVTTGATGKFRLAPEVKEAKPKTENVDPNVQKVPKSAKDETKKPKKAGAAKKKDPASEEATSQEESKPPKRSKKEKEATTSKAAPEVTTSKVAPAKKPKAKKAAEEKEDVEGVSDSAKTKATKTTKVTKAGKPSLSKAAKAGSDAKATGKRGKKTPE
ncbi:protein B4 [Cottoperca gobio]|uniref:Protein B4 n=1 Tax=Cottoperca gobio TaxID=56716 RepID=A0A6J2PNN4_COTGO|nr:protein B4 [Cottoperca gobio]